MSVNSLRIVVLLLLILIVGLYFYTDKQQQYFQATAEPAAKKILRDISSWNAADMRRHLSPQASNTLSDQQLHTLLVRYRPLGRLISVNELFFSNLMSVFSLLGETRVSYSGTAIFENGPGSFTLTLIRLDNIYYIYSFNLSAD